MHGCIIYWWDQRHEVALSLRNDQWRQSGVLTLVRAHRHQAGIAASALVLFVEVELPAGSAFSPGGVQAAVPGVPGATSSNRLEESSTVTLSELDPPCCWAADASSPVMAAAPAATPAGSRVAVLAAAAAFRRTFLAFLAAALAALATAAAVLSYASWHSLCNRCSEPCSDGHPRMRGNHMSVIHACMQEYKHECGTGTSSMPRRQMREQMEGFLWLCKQALFECNAC